MFRLEHPSSTVDVKVDTLAHAASRFENTVWDLSASLTRGYRAIDTLGKYDGLWQRCLTFPAKLAVFFSANLIQSAMPKPQDR